METFFAAVSEREELHLTPTPYDMFMVRLLYSAHLSAGTGRNVTYTKLLELFAQKGKDKKWD